jgi:hypothetical protein
MQDSPTGLMTLNGRPVEFAYDPGDLETVAVYHGGTFVGLARNLELRGMGEQTFVEDEKLRNAYRRETKRIIAAVHQAVPIPDAEERALRRMEVAPRREEPIRPEVPFAVPPGIAAAVAAIDADKRGLAQPVHVERREAESRDDDESEFNFFT